MVGGRETLGTRLVQATADRAAPVQNDIALLAVALRSPGRCHSRRRKICNLMPCPARPPSIVCGVKTLESCIAQASADRAAPVQNGIALLTLVCAAQALCH